MSYTALSIILIIYGLGLYLWNSRTIKRLGERTSIQIRYVHHFLAFLVLVSVALRWVDDLSFSGQWTTRIIVIGFLFTGIFIYPLTDWASKNRLEKFYFRLFSFLPPLMGFILLIPFTGALVFSITIGQLIDPATKVYFDDDKLRVQSSYLGPVWLPGIFVYEKKGILERQLVKTAISDFQIDSVGVTYQQEKTFVIFHSQGGKLDTLSFKRIE